LVWHPQKRRSERHSLGILQYHLKFRVSFSWNLASKLRQMCNKITAVRFCVHPSRFFKWFAEVKMNKARIRNLLLTCMVSGLSLTSVIATDLNVYPRNETANAASTELKAQKQYPRALFSVTKIRINSVREPHGWTWYLQSDEATVALSAIATYFGINPAYVIAAQQAIPTSRGAGEETFYNLPVSPGYRYCGSRITVISMNPGSGDRAALLKGAAWPEIISFYTVTPVLGVGQGRSWVDADVELYSIQSSYYSEFERNNICASVTTSYNANPNPAVGIIDCKGDCASVVHGNLNRARQLIRP
jgi:hypothetical protein